MKKVIINFIKKVFYYNKYNKLILECSYINECEYKHFRKCEYYNNLNCLNIKD